MLQYDGTVYGVPTIQQEPDPRRHRAKEFNLANGNWEALPSTESERSAQSSSGHEGASEQPPPLRRSRSEQILRNVGQTVGNAALSTLRNQAVQAGQSSAQRLADEYGVEDPLLRATINTIIRDFLTQGTTPAAGDSQTTSILRTALLAGLAAMPEGERRATERPDSNRGGQQGHGSGHRGRSGRGSEGRSGRRR
jgi:hypothetical protein